jgi:hypothetical protein
MHIERKALHRVPRHPGAARRRDWSLHAARRHIEFIRFLKPLTAESPAGEVTHAVLDNYATHKHPTVLACLSRHPGWTFHLSPASAHEVTIWFSC